MGQAGSGARLHFADTVEESRARAVAHAVSTGKTFVSAYNDPDVVAGSGTIGLEILEDAPETDLVLVGMAGGGIACGIGIALKSGKPDAQLWGVQPEHDAVLGTWLEAGKPVPVDARRSLATGLGGLIEEDSITFALAKRWVDRTVRVSDDAICEAMAILLEDHQLVVEPSGAAPLAGLLQSDVRGRRGVTLVLTGKLISGDPFLGYVARGKAATPAARR